MKMKTILRFNALALLLMSLIFSGCGDDGTDGMDGLNGTSGKDGKDGKDGASLDLDAVTRDGYIKLLASGTVAGQAFKDTVLFAYSELSDNSSTRIDSEDYLVYLVDRNASAIQTDNNASITIATEKSSQETQVRLYVNTTVGLGGNKLAVINTGDFPVEIPADAIRELHYDAAKHRVTYKFAAIIPAAGNNTGNDLSVSGEVDAIVHDSYIH